MSESEREELKELYRGLFDEFQRGDNPASRDNKWASYIFRESNIPNPFPDCNRYLEGFSYGGSSIKYLDSDYFRYTIMDRIHRSNYYDKIFDFIIDHGLSPFQKTSIAEDKKRKPSISFNLISGFITRIYDLKLNEKLRIDSAFNQSFKELSGFFMNETLVLKTLVTLYGPTGDAEIISLDENISIKRADYSIVKQFGILYNDINHHHTEILENDYYIEFKTEINKGDYTSLFPFAADNTLKKIHTVLALSYCGNIELGKMIFLPDAWPLIPMKRGSAPTKPQQRYNHTNKFICIFSEAQSEKTKTNWVALKDIDLDSLDPLIQSSIKRILKAKSTPNIEDRIIEMVLAIEYLINTQTYEVTLQLCWKVINFLDKNTDLNKLYKQLRRFLNLRGDIFHGNKPVIPSDENINLLKLIEQITNELLLKFIPLSKKYSYKQINKALNRSMYNRKSINEILNEISTPMPPESVEPII